MGKLDGKVALVTGAARGIGKEICLALARDGADIVLAARTREQLERAAGEVGALGKKGLVIPTDVTDSAQVRRLVQKTIAEFGKVDILVNNAGITRFAPFLEMTEADWDAVLDVDLKGTFLVSQAVAKHMVVRKYGKIINISSVVGIGALNETMANYGPSKAGVNNLTKVMAIALGGYGINVNAVAPGAVRTEMGLTRRTPEEYEQFLEKRKNQTALKMVGDVKDIAHVVRFLASDESAFITGQVIAVDGGRTNKI